MSEVNIPQKIEEIIAKRKQRLASLETAKSSVDEAAKRIREFKSFQNKMKSDDPAGISMVNGDYSIMERISSISTEEFSKLYDDYSREFDKLVSRLNRDSLNISFVGREGQGKSLIMKNISGLDNSVIPSSNGTSCTGAKSIITNVDSDTVTAEITFYSGAEIVKIINEYLQNLTKKKKYITEHWEIPSIDVDAIQTQAEEAEGATDDVAEMCDNLREYVEYYDQYKGDLGNVISVEKDQIEKYVSHYSCKDPNVKYYKHIAVKLANIKARFPYSDVGRIVLVDTIGLGKTAIGVEDEMLNAVENDSDAIILITRPDPKRYSLGPDWNLLKRIQERISKVYTKEMLFWVLNRVESGEGNVAGVNALLGEINRKDFAVAKALNVNCFSQNEVINGMLIPVLEHLSARITEVDKRLIEKLNRLGERLFNAYKEVCTATDCAFADSADADLKREFSKKIGETFRKNLLGELRKLYLREYAPRREVPCQVLMEAAHEKLNNILNCIPSKEQIVNLTADGTYNQVNIYEHCTDLMRMSIIDDFTGLNVVLDKLVEEMKKDILKIFAGEEYGRLGAIAPLTDDCSSSEWIDSFIEKTKCEEKYKLIGAALQKFRAYTISVQGFLIHEVRDQLDCIDISLNTEIPAFSASMIESDKLADEIYEWLRTYAEEIYEKVERSLNNLYTTPNKSLFAAIKDLFDRITYSNAEDGIKAQDDWRHLYEDWIPLIWKEEYQEKSAMQSIAEQWNAVTDSLGELNSVDNFTIAN